MAWKHHGKMAYCAFPPLSYIINWREGSGKKVSAKTWRIWAKSDAIWSFAPMVSPAVQPRSQEKNKVQLPPSF